MGLPINRLIATGLGCLALLLGLALFGVEAQAVDPQSLIGEWQGTWNLATNKGVNGQYFMTIKKVEDNKVQGRVERSNVSRGVPPDFNFTGTLTGNVLKFQTGPATTELTIDGNEMRGTQFGSYR